jgi:hypothetical protein
MKKITRLRSKGIMSFDKILKYFSIRRVGGDSQAAKAAQAVNIRGDYGPHGTYTCMMLYQSDITGSNLDRMARSQGVSLFQE